MATKEQYDDLVKRLERMEATLNRIESKLPGGGGVAASGGGVAYVDAYDKLTNDFFKPFLDLSNKLGGDIAAQVKIEFTQIYCNK